MGAIVNDDQVTGHESDNSKTTSTAVNPQLAVEMAALEAEAAESSQAGAPDMTTPAGQWEAVLLDVLPPVFQFVDPEDEFEMVARDYQQLAKGVAPALGKHFPDLQNMLRDIPVELSAALAVGLVMVPKIRKINARRAAEAAKEVKPDAASESA
jgi:hypothetical protein